MPDDDLAERCLLRHTAARPAAGEIAPEDAVGTVRNGIGENADEVEWRFAAAVTRSCCRDCLGAWEEEAFRGWEREMAATAAELVAADGNPLTASWRR
ncbi:hypothetical protein [Kitasatospora sp. NPDC059599]|uniref:hypothetical protein n=1 Tax=Kitasatospora sp. NPDC059599 TaxID=3346880 RepID=UPI00367B0D23